MDGGGENAYLTHTGTRIHGRGFISSTHTLTNIGRVKGKPGCSDRVYVCECVYAVLAPQERGAHTGKEKKKKYDFHFWSLSVVHSTRKGKGCRVEKKEKDLFTGTETFPEKK